MRAGAFVWVAKLSAKFEVRVLRMTTTDSADVADRDRQAETERKNDRDRETAALQAKLKHTETLLQALQRAYSAKTAELESAAAYRLGEAEEEEQRQTVVVGGGECVWHGGELDACVAGS